MAKAKYKKGKDGYYRTKAWDGTYNDDGSKHRIHLCSKKSSADLEKQVNELKNNIASGQNRVFCDFYFQEYATHWINTKKSVREENTQSMYKNVIDVHFAFLADVKLTNIRNSHFCQAINNQREHPNTCQKIYITFTQVMRMAVADHYITKAEYEDIISDVDLPKIPKSQKRPLSEVEKETLKKCFQNGIFSDRERAFLTLIYYCGLRKQEALALTKFDFKFSKKVNTVSISRVIIFSVNTPKIKQYPKSDNGIRTIPLPAEAAAYIKGYINSLSGTNLFSCSTNPLITKSSYDKMWASIIKKMNEAAGGTEAFPVIDDLTAHIFRHNYCSSLCYKVPTISLSKIATLMGDTLAVVTKVYTHIVEEKENVSEALEDALVI